MKVLRLGRALYLLTGRREQVLGWRSWIVDHGGETEALGPSGRGLTQNTLSP